MDKPTKSCYECCHLNDTQEVCLKLGSVANIKAATKCVHHEEEV